MCDICDICDICDMCDMCDMCDICDMCDMTPSVNLLSSLLARRPSRRCTRWAERSIFYWVTLATTYRGFGRCREKVGWPSLPIVGKWMMRISADISHCFSRSRSCCGWCHSYRKRKSRKARVTFPSSFLWCSSLILCHWSYWLICAMCLLLKNRELPVSKSISPGSPIRKRRAERQRLFVIAKALAR